MCPSSVRYGSPRLVRRFSRSASSASATLIVMTPLAWPVMTRDPSAGSARNSNAGPRRQRQAERVERVDETPLRRFEAIPSLFDAGERQIGNDARQTAGQTER